ncbi:MAG: hypothetical protein AAF542_18125 [Pseudomonadota bacterium]
MHSVSQPNAIELADYIQLTSHVVGSPLRRSWTARLWSINGWKLDRSGMTDVQVLAYARAYEVCGDELALLKERLEQ